MKAPRVPWRDFPDVFLHAGESQVKGHPWYSSAKSGDADAAVELVQALINSAQVETLRKFLAGQMPLLASAHAYETAGVNAIPEVFADELAVRLGLATDNQIVQTNVVAHTGSDGFGRLARQPLFAGEICVGACYVLVDDFVGMGGTLANLRGFVEGGGGLVLAAVTLTGKPHSARLRLDDRQLVELREKHGTELEKWWQDRFGHAFDCLTQSEARYLAHSPDVETIRDRIVAAEQAGDRRAGP